jgi:hypothetical protein
VSKSKTNVKVLSADGAASWTTRRGAARICGRGLAEWLGPKLIRMIKQDHRIDSVPAQQPRPQNTPLLAVVAFRPQAFDGFGQTFLPYPQKAA